MHIFAWFTIWQIISSSSIFSLYIYLKHFKFILSEDYIKNDKYWGSNWLAESLVGGTELMFVFDTNSFGGADTNSISERDVSERDTMRLLPE